MDWKSGANTSFAPPATGDMDCRGFWEHGKPDKRGIWTSNRQLAPGLADYTERISNCSRCSPAHADGTVAC